MAVGKVMFRQEHGVVSAVKNAVDGWKTRNGFTPGALLLQGVERFEELKVLVAMSVDAYVAQYDSVAERAIIPGFQGMEKETARFNALRYKQELDMLRYHV
jgi:hypothetical protein